MLRAEAEPLSPITALCRTEAQQLGSIPTEAGGGYRAQAEMIAPDFDWVLPNLALGGRLATKTVECLVSRFGIRWVVDLRSEERDDRELLARHRVALLHLPTPDLHPVSQELLWTGVAWVREGLARGDKVLIHCQHGIGRSALLACCVLVSLGELAQSALERAKQAREKVSPSPEQLHALLQWSAAWYCGQAIDCPSVTWDELASIAYRHLAQATSVADPP